MLGLASGRESEDSALAVVSEWAPELVEASAREVVEARESVPEDRARAGLVAADSELAAPVSAVLAQA